MTSTRTAAPSLASARFRRGFIVDPARVAVDTVAKPGASYKPVMRRHTKPALAAALIAASLLAACGSGSKPSSHTSTRTSALAYSRCMRSHGVTSFPDPNSKGQIQLTASPGNGLDPNSPIYKKADAACKSLMPTPSAAQQRQSLGKALAFAKCMRAHGLKDFQDPQPASSGPQTHSQAGGANGGTGPDPNSPQFKSAMQACRNLLPSDAEFNTSSAGDGS
jgi:hypothetical protein